MERDQGTAPGQTIAIERATAAKEVPRGTVSPRDSSALLRALGFILEPMYNEKITLA